jgi:hypothetical protein
MNFPSSTRTLSLTSLPKATTKPHANWAYCNSKRSIFTCIREYEQLEPTAQHLNWGTRNCKKWKLRNYRWDRQVTDWTSHSETVTPVLPTRISTVYVCMYVSALRPTRSIGLWQFMFRGTACKIVALYAGFDVLTAVVINVSIFWDTAPCSLHVNQRFGGHPLHAGSLLT